jgi:hypothetical protein
MKTLITYSKPSSYILISSLANKYRLRPYTLSYSNLLIVFAHEAIMDLNF